MATIPNESPVLAFIGAICGGLGIKFLDVYFATRSASIKKKEANAAADTKASVDLVIQLREELFTLRKEASTLRLENDQLWKKYHDVTAEKSVTDSELVSIKLDLSLLRKEHSEAIGALSQGLVEGAVYFAPVAICITHWEEDFAKVRYLYVNPAFTAIFGYTIEELIGRDPMMFYGEKSSMDQITNRQKTLKARKTYNDSNVFYRKDGTVVTCKWSEAGLFKDGAMYAVVAIINEV